MCADNRENIYSNKLQIRARLLSAIVNLQQKALDLNFINSELLELQSIEDKSAVMSILEKEFLKENTEARDYTISFLMRNLVSQEQIESVIFEDLANPQINDLLKSKLVNLLRESGNHINYEQYTSYFENPDVIIDADTERLLENAKINPESQIDFLDFLAALPSQEKEMLLNSLSEDYDGDNLANILIPVILSNPYNEVSGIAISSIGTTRSKLAYSALIELYDVVDDVKVKANIQKSLNLLKLAGIKEDVSKEYYKELLSKSPIYSCCTSFPDGQGNLGLIFARENISKYIQIFAVVLNDTDGIVDCFGFNEITKTEYSRILSKFYQGNDVINIKPAFAKYLMVEAEKLTRKKYDEIPYEYVVWKNITNDIDYEEINLEKGLEKSTISLSLLEQLYSHSYFDTWFLSVQENSSFDETMKLIVENKISSADAMFDIIEENKNKILDSDTLSLLNNRLILSSYIAKEGDRCSSSQILYSLTFDGDVRDLFLNDYLKKSVYQYFLMQKDRYESIKNAKTIFQRKDNSEKIDINYVQLCIEDIEKNWIS